MYQEMRVKGHDAHGDALVTFAQQMIPHHANAVNMAKLLLKHAPAAVKKVEDLENILWSIINQQNHEIHQFRNYLADHAAYTAVSHEGANLNAESVGQHCSSTIEHIP